MIIILFSSVFLFNCQTNDLKNPNKLEGNAEVKAGDGFLDLSQFSLEQQKIEREEAAKKLAELKSLGIITEEEFEAKKKELLGL